MRTRLVFAVCVSMGLGLGPALGQSLQERYVDQLTKQGYTEFTINRTWLGRTRIVASSKTLVREIIFNTRSGEVLRDYLEDKDSEDNQLEQELFDFGSDDGGEESGGGNSGGGSGGGESGGGGSGGGSGNAGLLDAPFQYLTAGLADDVPYA